MPACFLLLRLFLIIALVFNGATSAAASVAGMVQAHAVMTEHAMAGSDDAPCHEMASMRAYGDAAAVAQPEVPNKGKLPSGYDCCKSSDCRCTCVQAASAVTPLFRDAPVAIAHTPSIRSLAVGHPNPALPHLIRPPIG